jgi:hypothetical protein
MTTTKTTKTAPAKAAAKAKAASKPTPAAKPSVGRLIREAVILDQTATYEMISEKLAAAGFKDVKRSTIDTFKYDCLATLRIARDLGMLKTSKPAPKPAPVSEPAPEVVQGEEVSEAA